MAERFTPPGNLASRSAHLEAPASLAGSFSFINTLDPLNEGLIYPVDEETGLPHLIRIFHEPDINDTVYDYDHSWFHRLAPCLRDAGGQAVRASMGQLIPLDIHRIKNRRFSHMSWMPETDAEKFKVVVKGVSGVVSRWAVDVRRAEDDLLVHLDDAEYAYLTDRKRLFREKAFKDRPANLLRDSIGAFLVQYAIQQNVRDVVPNKFIECFLNTEDENQRKAMGNAILKLALTAEVEPIASTHSQLSKKGLVRPGALSPVVAVRKLIDKQRLPQFYPSLKKRLLAV